MNSKLIKNNNNKTQFILLFILNSHKLKIKNTKTMKLNNITTTTKKKKKKRTGDTNLEMSYGVRESR